MFAQILAQTPNYTSVDTALLIVRVVFGLTLAMHGWQKFFTGGRMPGTAGWFDGMGMKPGKVMAPLAASTEIGAGLGFAIGLLTPRMSAGCVGIMLVAAWTVHREEFFIVKGGWEYNMVLATGTVGVAMIGPGRFSLDRTFGFDGTLSGWLGLALSAGLGIVGGVSLLAAFYRPPAPESDTAP